MPAIRNVACVGNNVVDTCTGSLGVAESSDLNEEFIVASDAAIGHFACRLSEEPNPGQKVTFQLDATENEKATEVLASCVVEPGTVSNAVTTSLTLKPNTFYVVKAISSLGNLPGAHAFWSLGA